MITICCVATGPSLTVAQIDAARSRGFLLFACNNAFQLVPDAALLYGCNYSWWSHYWTQVKDLPAEKWTTNRQAADEFGINWIAERNAKGLSTDPDVIHHGFGSGFSLVSMAYRAGAKSILLLGYDLKFASDYDGRSRQIGSTPRHFFGEYPPQMAHWPSVQVRHGVHIGLVELYRSIHEQGLVELICVTPHSALEGVIPSMDISDVV
jgi:hypothetical protein